MVPITTVEQFSEFLLGTFTEGRGLQYTDVYVQPDKPLRGRKGQNDWEEIIVDGKTVEIKKVSFAHIMAQMLGEPDKPKNDWANLLDVNKNGGCLYPMLRLEREDPNDPSKNLMYRARLTLQRQGMGESFGLMVRMLRPVPTSLTDLGLPITLNTIIESRAGLLLITGPTGAGKSTTTAGIVNEINRSRCSNIVTIEDPVEFLHEDNNSVVTSREVGVDVTSYAEGVQQVLRFVPDVIVIGEIRDAKTMRDALRASESGHFVMGTIHASTAIGAIKKVMGFLEGAGEKISFASNLVGVIAQALFPKGNGEEKALAYEILDLTSRAASQKFADVIGRVANGDASSLKQYEDEFASSKLSKSPPFSKTVMKLIEDGVVDYRLVLPLLDGDGRTEAVKLAMKTGAIPVDHGADDTIPEKLRDETSRTVAPASKPAPSKTGFFSRKP